VGTSSTGSAREGYWCIQDLDEAGHGYDIQA
jgi:hypothetical protein